MHTQDHDKFPSTTHTTQLAAFVPTERKGIKQVGETSGCSAVEDCALCVDTGAKWKGKGVASRGRRGRRRGAGDDGSRGLLLPLLLLLVQGAAEGERTEWGCDRVRCGRRRRATPVSTRVPPRRQRRGTSARRALRPRHGAATRHRENSDRGEARDRLKRNYRETNFSVCRASLSSSRSMCCAHLILSDNILASGAFRLGAPSISVSIFQTKSEFKFKKP